MRPHSAAAIAILLYLLQNANSKQEFFTVTLVVKQNGSEKAKKEYDLYLAERSANKYKLRIGNMWTCEVEIIRPSITEDRFIIKHNHRTWIEEEVRIYSDRLEGRYLQHPTFKEFKSYSLKLDNFELRTDYQGFSYELKQITAR